MPSEKPPLVFVIEIGRGLLLDRFLLLLARGCLEVGQSLDVNDTDLSKKGALPCDKGMNSYRVDAGLEFDQSIGCVSF